MLRGDILNKSKAQENFHTQSILQAHHNTFGGVADEAPVVQRLGGRASDEIPTMDPHHDGQRGHQRTAEVHIQRDKDVEVETVLAHLFGTSEEIIIQFVKMFTWC